jgi:hypothetical protein
MDQRSLLPRIGVLLAVCVVLLLSLSAWTLAQGPGDAPEKVKSLDPEAVDVLKKAMRFLAEARSLRVKSDAGFDVVQDSGRKLEFGKSGTTVIQRPNKLRVETERRDGTRYGLVFDGKRITAYSPGENIYATASLAGDLDEALAYIEDQLEIPVPLADFLYSDPAAVLAERVDSALHMGEAKIKGLECDHLALSNDYVDYQIWIATGDEPLPRRVVITYKHSEGQPQYWSFMEWEVNPKLSGALFAYDPPKDADRIPFAPRQPVAAQEEANR